MVEKGNNFNIDVPLKVGSKPISMIWVPPGNFVLGKDHIDLSKTQFDEGSSCLIVNDAPAKVSKGFWLSQNLIICQPNIKIFV